MTIFAAVSRTITASFPKGRFWPFWLLRRSAPDTQPLNRRRAREPNEIPPTVYGIVAETSFEYPLFTPVESTEVTT